MIRKDRKPTAVLTDCDGKTGFHQKSTYAVKTSRGPSLLSETDCHCSNTLERITGRNNTTALDFPQVMPMYKRTITFNFLMH